MTTHTALGLRGICLTFDNLGEAAELQAGIWPIDKTVGNHPSISEGLPWLLEALRDRPASLFVEGWSAETYPEAVRSIVRAGKEVCLHGYRHEFWHSVGDQERQILVRSKKVLTELGIEAFGFRPPGGPPAHDTFAVLSELGFEYCSCLGRSPGVAGGLPVVTYTWNCVDAFHIEPILANLRVANGIPPEAVSPSAFVPVVRSRVDALKDTGGILVLMWHPYLLVTREQRSAFLEAMEIVDRARVPLLSCREAALRIGSSLLKGAAPVLEDSVGSRIGAINEIG